MSRFATSIEYKQWLDSLPPEAFRPLNGADTLVTYSGREGENHNLAKTAVAADPDNKYCIEQTPAGAGLDHDKLFESGGMSKKEAAEVWRHASEKTMEHAQASKMETYVVDAKHDGIFRGSELSTALANPNIKTINDVPCEKHMAQYDPQKIHESVCQAELARDEQRLSETNDPALKESLAARQTDLATWQQEGDKFTPERQAMQDKADASHQGWRNSPEGQKAIAEAQILGPPPPELPPPPPPPPPLRSEQSQDQGHGR